MALNGFSVLLFVPPAPKALTEKKNKKLCTLGFGPPFSD